MELVDLLHLPVAFIVSFITIKLLIPYLTRLKFGQYVREDGPQSHLQKAGTPTMGGIGFLIGLLITVLIFIWSYDLLEVLPILIMVMGFGVIGFMDDYLKVVKKESEGLKPKQKIIGQLVLTAGLIIYVMTQIGTEIYMPFTNGETYIELGWFYIPFAAIVILGTDNGVNLTDGIDGLATSVTVIVAAVLTLGELWMRPQAYNAGVSMALIGALLAFLWFNRHPAKVFMGDTGSLALGGYVVTMALLQKNPLIIVIIGLVYLVETVSVMMQVTYFKKTGKRIFKMAPIHHHFELSGMSEVQVVIMFVGITLVMGVIGVLSM